MPDASRHRLTPARATAVPFMAAAYSVRADRGNDHSNEKPNFMAGALGGCGSTAELVPEPDARVWSTSTGDFVCVPMASFVTVGGTQLRLLP
jgi:hypothetical protein